MSGRCSVQVPARHAGSRHADPQPAVTPRTCGVGAWELAGVSMTPRWAFATATNRGVPVDEFALVPGRSTALPGVADLVRDLAGALATGVLEDVFVNIPIEICSGSWSLVGSVFPPGELEGRAQHATGVAEAIDSYYIYSCQGPWPRNRSRGWRTTRSGSSPWTIT
jgi:hypothetical protein